MDALDRLAPVADDYATLPVEQAFDWRPVAEALEPSEWYLVAFRSIQRLDADAALLTRHDDWAHHEAEGAPGFIHYFKGPLASDRTCLSFCLWNSRAEARAAAARPAHQDAAALIAEMYEAYTLEFITVRKAAGATILEFTPYDAVAAEGDQAPVVPSPQLGFNPAAS